VYGQRRTAYEVLAGFTRSLGAVVSGEDVLPEIARHAAEGLVGAQATVTAYLPDGNQTASYPLDVSAAEQAEVVAVLYRGEPVGEIAVSKPGAEQLINQERRLLQELASQAGVVLHNYRLTVELRSRLRELSIQDRELKESRERLVSAADTSRRAIEQAIHESVERKLVAIGSDLSSAEAALTNDPSQATAMLEDLAERTNETLEALRDLARGIYPPLLADKGLVVALEAHIRKVGLDATLEVDGELAEARFDRAVETSCYFCVRETLDNVARHASGAHAKVRIHRDAGRLVFSVSDQGPGFDMNDFQSRGGLQSMRDRIEASGGEVEITSAPGKGTTVTGWVPLAPSEESADQELLAAAQASSS
jgi:signal transduction histidine kinase